MRIQMTRNVIRSPGSAAAVLSSAWTALRREADMSDHADSAVAIREMELGDLVSTFGLDQGRPRVDLSRDLTQHPDQLRRRGEEA
jgi:hypothetical protein